MTWSIVAFDPPTGAFGVVVATRALAVGASCPFVRSGVGAVATQSMTNRALGPAVLDALASGCTPSEAISKALEPDGGRSIRQLHAIDKFGRTASWTGENCVEWCGSLSATNISVAGNMLAGADVIARTCAAYAETSHLTFQDRLLSAMDEGEAAGGDRRGRQSAAMLITTTEDFPDLDLRVDDHATPLGELRRLTTLWQSHWLARKSWMPTKTAPSGTANLDVIEAAWQAQGLDIKFRR